MYPGNIAFQRAWFNEPLIYGALKLIYNYKRSANI